MGDRETTIEKIHDAFKENDYPGDIYLQGSFEGCEPYEEIEPFKGKNDWKTIETDILDAHSAALSFFSQAGFRFFLPAYLIADLQGKLNVADPLFHLTHGFSDSSVNVSVKDRDFLIRTGKSEFVNPRRYGATTFYDYSRYRLSVFTREEANAIVAYLKYKRDSDPGILDKEKIDSALNSFWLERIQTAPLAESIRSYIKEKEEFIAAISNNRGNYNET
jgi:hypothetical protein